MDNNSFQGNNGFGNNMNMPNGNMPNRNGQPFQQNGNFRKPPFPQGNQMGANQQKNMQDMNQMVQTGRIPADVVNQMVQTGRVPTELISSMASNDNMKEMQRGKMNPTNLQNPGANMDKRNMQGPANRGNMGGRNMPVPPNMDMNKKPEGMPPVPPAQPMPANTQMVPPVQPLMPPQPAKMPTQVRQVPMQQGQVTSQGGRPVLRTPNPGERPAAPLQLSTTKLPNNSELMRMETLHYNNRNKKSKSGLFVTLAVLVVMLVAAVLTKDMWISSAKNMLGKITDNGNELPTVSGTPTDNGELTSMGDGKGPYYINIYYEPKEKLNPNKIFIHYKLSTDENWTTSPGIEMEPTDEQPGFSYKYTIEFKNKGAVASVVFNDGNNVWDNNDGNQNAAQTNYTIVEGTYGISDGIVYVIDSPELKCKKDEITIYYSGFDTPYIHYKLGTGGWTDLPGVPMDVVAMELTTISKNFSHYYNVPMNGAKSMLVAFNDGSKDGSWDSNGSKNFTLIEGTYLRESLTFTRYLPISELNAGEAETEATTE